VEIQLNLLRRRLSERHIEIELTGAAKTHLVRTGYDPIYGARPLKRAIQREIETSLGRRILKGEVRDGQKVVIDFDRASGRLVFTTEAAITMEQVASGGD
jgi:ATP-dependent Clp protease ATP-binding subunit ClpB